MNTNNYKYLWTTEKEHWVLVNTVLGYAVVNKKEKCVLSFSDEKLEEAVIREMLENGNKIFDNINDAYNDN